MRRKYALISMAANLIYQIVALLSGFIVQRLLLSCYGSELVGVTASITKFLGFITLAEAGMGSVVVATLYKPLLKGDTEEISGIVTSSNRFFRRLAVILALYIVILGIVFPLFGNALDLSRSYFFLLTLSIGLSSLMQYYLGMTNQLLLQADQKQFVPTALNIITAAINTLFVYVLTQVHVDIVILKLVTSLVFIIKPVCLFAYCRRNYKLSNNGTPSKMLNSQRWAGLGHHLSYFVHSSTDVAILTLLGRYGEVAVYSLYTMIAGNLTNIIDCASGGLQAAFGNVMASKDNIALQRHFAVFETVIHICVTVVFGTAAIMVIPFMAIYTKGLSDAQYILPVFGCVCMLQEAAFCLRRPYVMIISAAGHFKQTQWHGYVEAGLNIAISVLLVGKYGLVGLSIGTASAMLFRLIVSVIYLRKEVLIRKATLFVRCVLCDVFALLLPVSICLILKDQFEMLNYVSWCLTACGVFVLLFGCTLFVYCIGNRKVFNAVITELRDTFKLISKPQRN